MLKGIECIKAQQEKMIEQLHLFCHINSGTDNLDGLHLMREALQEAYAPLADHIEQKTLAPVPAINMSGQNISQHFGQALFIRKRPHLKRRVLLSGHMDTVYPINSPFQTLSYLNKNTINGPGVADMKGGLIVMLHALAAFEQQECAQELGWDVLINSDEEVGSPSSSMLFKELVSQYQAALVYEPAMDNQGTLAKNRKGSAKYTLLAKGKAAHAGRAFYEGRNAICYLAEIVGAVHALNGQREGVTLNIGKIAGGEALNVVPDLAVAKIDIRISHPDDELWIKQAFSQIEAQFKRADFTLHIDGHFGRPVKRVNPATERLYQRLLQVGQQLNLEINWKDSGGCCDGNNLAQHSLAVLDTLGVRGGHIHSPNEYILLDSLTERAQLSALLLMDLAQGGLEDLNNDVISSCI